MRGLGVDIVDENEIHQELDRKVRDRASLLGQTA